MDRTVKKVESCLPEQAKITRVCAYARVSSAKDAMLHSLSAQVSYYNALIQKHKGWVFCDVFTDEGITGTKSQRPGFQMMLAKCRAGEIDMIITKSISRFARNTLTLLETVREMKNLGIDIFFEEQNIHTLSANGELMISIFASIAEEESRSVSENMKWRIKKNFEEGKPWNGRMLGYRYDNGVYKVIPEEAEIVRKIYHYFLDEGLGIYGIIKQLDADGIKAKNGKRWGQTTVNKILHNPTYTGNLLLQRVFRENYLTKKTKKNNGELPQYYVENAHEAIIPAETFEAVQLEFARRHEIYKNGGKHEVYPYTGLITCGICGGHYRRKTTATRVVWICKTYNNFGKAECPSKQIPEETLDELLSDLPFEKITAIKAMPGNTVVIQMQSGEEIIRQWEDRSRSESWTPEMRAKVGQKTRERNKKNEGKTNR